MGKKLAYAAPQLSLTSLTMLIGIHGTIFYTKIGAKVAFIAFFTALARSFDVVTDPLMGWLSDKTRTQYGRRRPYMITGCWGYALCFLCLFNPPRFESGVQTSLWFGVFYVIFYLFDTMSNVPYGALGPELSDDSAERDSLFFWAKLVNGVGILFGAVGPVVVGIALKSKIDTCVCSARCPAGAAGAAAQGLVWNSTMFGNFSSAAYSLSRCLPSLLAQPNASTAMLNWCACRKTCDTGCDIDSSRQAFALIAASFGLWYCGSMVYCVLRIRERDASQEEASPPLIPSLLATLRNKPFMGLLPAWVCDMTAYTMIGTMLPFYVEYIIIPSGTPECADGQRAILGLDSLLSAQDDMWCKTETWLGVGLVCLIAAQLVSMPLWLMAARRVGKFKAWLAFNLATALTNGLFVFIGEGDPKWCMVLAFFNGLPSGAQFLTDSIVADVIDYDEFLTGKRSEGRFTIFQTFIPKLVSIPSQAIPLALLSVFGFVPPLRGQPQPQPSGVRVFIKVVFFVLPCMLAIASFFIKTRFPIRDEAVSRQILAGAALHMAGHPAMDPLTGKTKALFPFRSAAEEEQSYRLDSFFRASVRLVAEGRTPQVVKRMQRLCVLGFLTFSVFFLLMLVSVLPKTNPIGTSAAGEDAYSWIELPTLSWVPAFSVIICGVSISSVGFNYMRLKEARALVTQPLPNGFAQRWLVHLQGTDEAANDVLTEEDLVTAISDANEEHREEFEGALLGDGGSGDGGGGSGGGGDGVSGDGSGGKGRRRRARVKPSNADSNNLPVASIPPAAAAASECEMGQTVFHGGVGPNTRSSKRKRRQGSGSRSGSGGGSNHGRSEEQHKDGGDSSSGELDHLFDAGYEEDGVPPGIGAEEEQQLTDSGGKLHSHRHSPRSKSRRHKGRSGTEDRGHHHKGHRKRTAGKEGLA